jgi:uncharacterized protein (TIGR02757 family)
MAKRPIHPLPALRAVLDAVADSDGERAARVAADPVGLVHRYADPREQEVVGLYAAALAYGRVSLFLPILEELLGRLGRNPAAKSRELALADPGDALDLTEGLSYRMTRPRDLAELLRVTGAALARHGSLERLFLSCQDESEPDLAGALGRFRDELLERAPPDIDRTRIGLRRLLPDVKQGSASKRLFLYLRWMVRRDAVDLGAWPRVSAARLVMPLDAHIYRFARALGLTTRASPDLKAAREVTDGLRALDPRDPLRYDFHLCHLGMEEGCRGRRHEPTCTPCPLRSACVLYNARPRSRPKGRR